MLSTIATASLPDVETPTFQPGDLVRITNPNCAAGWRTTGVVQEDVLGITRAGWLTRECFLVVPEDGEFAGTVGVFFTSHLEMVAPASTAYVVHDTAGLAALPTGTVLEDTTGDLAVVEEGQEYRYLTVGRAVMSGDSPRFPLDSLSFGPWEIVNPEKLDEIAVEPDVIEVGDTVRVLFDGDCAEAQGYLLFLDGFQPGDLATVIQVDALKPGDLRVEFTRLVGEERYVKAGQAKFVSKAPADEGEGQVFVLDLEGLESLPAGSVLVDEDGDLAVIVAGGYVRPANFPDGDVARLSSTDVYPLGWLSGGGDRVYEVLFTPPTRG